MGCLKLTYDYQEQGEKNDSLKWSVWVNPESDFLGVVDQQTQGSGPEVLQASFYPKSFEYGNALLNAAGTLVGIGEQGLKFLRQYPNGPKDLARGLNNLVGSRVGTQRMASFLKNTFKGTKSLGSRLGGLGVVVSSADYFSNISDKSGYDHASYWLGMGVFAISYAVPVVGIIYGGAQLASYLYNGKSAEENIGKALGY